MGPSATTTEPRPGRPATFDALHGAIAARYARLSRRLQQVGEYALAHPDHMALETIAVIAERARVPPSSLIRFAKAFGYDGFSEMQRVFRQHLVAQTPPYSERIRHLRPGDGAKGRPPALLLDEFAARGLEALDRLRRDLPIERLEAAVAILAGADVVHVAAQRRAFPVAVYLAYLLAQLDVRVHLLDSVGGMLPQQGRGITARDALLAVSFRGYSPETLALVEGSRARGAPVVAITDGPLSPLARIATVSLEVVEAEVQSFRSLSASMCLALVLAVALGQRLEADAATAG
jgi:DNA-binding MurR/RpiR family transcriptional regulator